MSKDSSQLVVFEDEGYPNLLPLVYWRGVFDLRCGVKTLLERIEAVQGVSRPGLYVRPYLQAVTAETDNGCVCTGLAAEALGEGVLFVNGRALLFDRIETGGVDHVGMAGEQVAYVWAGPELASKLTAEVFLDGAALEQALAEVARVETDITLIDYPWQLVHRNIAALERDWNDFKGQGVQGRVLDGVHLLAQESIAIGQGSTIKPGTVIDAETGPIIIGENVTIRPNCTLEGPLYIGDGSLIQPGAVLNEGVSIGPVCKVGGELESSIIHGHSNKQHDGFLGHSYIGEWVNLAADTINSDLKNTYGPVRVPINGREVDSGEMFVGLTMGDHSKTSVNSMFSTGSVVGFACSVFSARFAPRFLPSFSWLTDEGACEALPNKVVEVARRVMARRQIEMTEAMERLFLAIPELAHRYEVTGQAGGSGNG